MPQNLILTDPGNTDTFSFRDNTPAAPQAPTDEASQFMAEWNQAQQRYRAGVAAGYSPNDAENLYLTPVENKWDILKKVPAPLRPQASTELDAAQVLFLKGVNAGYKPADSEKLYLNPAEQKWVASSSVRTPPVADPLLAHKEGALQELAAGYDPMQVMQGHPQQMFSDPKYVARFETAAAAATREKQRVQQEAATMASKVPLEAAKTLNELANIQHNKNFEMSPETAAAVKGLADAAKTRLIGQPAPHTAEAGIPADIGSTPSGASPKYLTKFKSAEDVGAAYRSGELSRDEAKKILADQFGIN